FAQKSAAQTLSHMENGYYSLSLSTTDTDAVGRLTLHVNKAGALPVFYEFQVAEEAVYDAIFAENATGALPVSADGISSTALAADASTAIGDAVLAALKSQDRRGVAQGAG